MKTEMRYSNRHSERQDAYERLKSEFEGLPEPVVRVRPIRTSRYKLKGGITVDELELLGAMRLWEPLSNIPVHPMLPDDFEPPLPSTHRLGCCGE